MKLKLPNQHGESLLQIYPFHIFVVVVTVWRLTNTNSHNRTGCGTFSNLVSKHFLNLVLISKRHKGLFTPMNVTNRRKAQTLNKVGWLTMHFVWGEKKILYYFSIQHKNIDYIIPSIYIFSLHCCMFAFLMWYLHKLTVSYSYVSAAAVWSRLWL